VHRQKKASNSSLQWRHIHSINSSDSTVESLDQQQRFHSGIARSTAAIPQWNRWINSSSSFNLQQ
jgi:hypothetical protein